MEKVVIQGEVRGGQGKSLARRLRRDGKIPAVIYGKDMAPITITISAREWEKLSRHLKRNAILEMELPANGGVQTLPVMVKELQRSFPGEQVLHIDFLRVSMERTIEVEIPIRLAGESRGVKAGGIVDQHLRTVKAVCLPMQIPEVIELDITGLEIGDSIHLHEVSISGLKFLEAGEIAIVTIIPPQAEEKPVVEESVEAPKTEKKEE
jgi:large subunit ribosomal protein L25